MVPGRRQFLAAIAPMAVGVGAWLSAGQEIPQRQRPRPPGPPDLEFPKIDRKALLRQNQKQIQQDVQRLFALAEELKGQVAKTDSSEILSLPLVQKAEEIEKLAKKIKNLARG